MTDAREQRPTISQKVLSSLVPTLLLGLNLLVFGTFAVYQSNQGEFLLPYGQPLLHYFLPGLTLFFALGLTALAISGRTGHFLRLFIILAATMSYVHGNLLLWDTGILDGTELDFSGTWRTVVDAALWLACGVLAYRYRDWLVVHGWKICSVLIVFQTIGAVAAVAEQSAPRTPSVFVFPDDLANFSPEKNIVHIVLDAFQASIFEEILAENPDLHEVFRGFTFFRDATTAAGITYLSIPAALSGKAFSNQQLLSEYREATLNGENLYSFLAAHDFAVDVATPLWWNAPTPAFSSYFSISTPYTDTGERLLSSALLLGDISLYRQAPHFLKPLIYQSGAWLLSGKLVRRPELQFKHFAHHAFMTDFRDRIRLTSDRPRYKYLHLLTPHAPFVSGPDCSFTGAELEYSKAAFKQQSRCTLEVITAFLGHLEALGIYDNALLLIHGDHGGGVPFEMVTADGGKTTSSEALHRIWGNPLPLVLIKPSGATGPLKVSENQVQLLDIPATVAGQLGLEHRFPGRSMFDGNRGGDIPRIYFTSKIHRNDAADRDYFEEFTLYNITGSIYELASWQKVESYLAPVTDTAGHYRWGTLITFGASGNFSPFRGKGWLANRLVDMTWTQGHEAVLSIPFPAAVQPVMLNATVKPALAAQALGPQRVSILVGGEKVGDWLVSNNGFEEFSMIIPARLLAPAGRTRIVFRLPDARAPLELGAGREQRKTALAFKTVRFGQLPGPIPEMQQDSGQ